tara:strand:- start:991 stop:1503 length:513 start_codon:yes stop_codon:yes gene_type:complete
MNDILILDNILKEVNSNEQESYVLFGKSLKIGGEDRDFLFHGERDLEFDKLNDSGLITIPVFPYVESLSAVRLLAKELNDKYDFLHTFGRREVHPQIAKHREGGSDVLEGHTLGFFDVEKYELGSRIKDRESYKNVSEELLERGMPSWRTDVSPIIDELKESIREEYLLK